MVSPQAQGKVMWIGALMRILSKTCAGTERAVSNPARPKRIPGVGRAFAPLDSRARRAWRKPRAGGRWRRKGRGREGQAAAKIVPASISPANFRFVALNDEQLSRWSLTSVSALSRGIFR